MHPSILGAGGAAALLVAAASAGANAETGAGAACPDAGAPVHEVFVAADQPGAWATPPAADGLRPGWRLDWITPAGDDAALAAAALPEAAERAARAASAGGAAHRAGRADVPVGRPRPALRLSVRSGPAWNGYLGVELRLAPPAGARAPRLPPGSSAWLALVEVLPAGSEGSPLARHLVRSVAGPLPLAARGSSQHLRALRWPEGAQPDRLRARAWVEGPDGRLLAMAGERCGPP